MARATIHTKRDSLVGINRRRLREALRVRLGVTSNAAIFNNRGDTWDTTQSEKRKAKQHREMLEKHLREADLSETQFLNYLRERLDDPGPVDPVAVNKTKLAREAKHARPARKQKEGGFVKLSSEVIRLAQLERELASNERVYAVTSDRLKEMGHFVKTIDTVSPEERRRLLEQAKLVAKPKVYRVYARSTFREPWELVVETSDRKEALKTMGDKERNDNYVKIEEQ